MEPFSRIYSRVILILILSSPATSCPISKMEDSNISLMKEDVTCEEDSKFYTPTNVQPECLAAALRCFRAELQTVRHECQDPQNVIMHTQEFLEDHVPEQKGASNSEGADASRCSCRRWPERPFLVFMDAMESLVQRVAWQDCRDGRR